MVKKVLEEVRVYKELVELNTPKNINNLVKESIAKPSISIREATFYRVVLVVVLLVTTLVGID